MTTIRTLRQELCCLPPAADISFDVPGLGSGKGEDKIVIDAGTGAMYYTNNHYGPSIVLT